MPAAAQSLSKLLPPLIVIRTNTALSVSHKFIPTTKSLEQLRTNRGQPNFQHFEVLDLNKQFEDVYYDTAAAKGQKDGGQLENNGIFVRRRQWTWEADKLSTFDQSSASADALPLHVECLTDKTACENLVQKVVPAAQLLLFGASKLKELITLKVHREIFKVDHRFKIHVDSLTGVDSRFRYSVGEIAVSEPFIGADSGFGGAGQKERNAAAEASLILKMADEVAGFMGAYEWAFPQAEGERERGVHGTLQAYLQYKRSGQGLD